jgi:hypothetical protein
MGHPERQSGGRLKNECYVSKKWMAGGIERKKKIRTDHVYLGLLLPHVKMLCVNRYQMVDGEGRACQGSSWQQRPLFSGFFSVKYGGDKSTIPIIDYLAIPS